MTAASVNIAVILGVTGGTGAWLIWTGWRPATEPLARVLTRLGRPSLRTEPVTRSNVNPRFGAQVRRIGAVERRLELYRADLRIMERSADDQAASIGAGALLGLMAGFLVLIPRFLAGIPVPWFIAGWVSLGGAAAGAVLMVVDLRESAAKRRKAFLNALAAYCVSVDMCMQVGAGPEQALSTAADGAGWQFRQLRQALSYADARNQDPWRALEKLGEDIEVPDLVELAKTIEHVAVQGAAVGDTVSGIAESIQARIVGAIETDSARNTVRMAIPATMLLVGFTVLIGYPAIRTMFGVF